MGIKYDTIRLTMQGILNYLWKQTSKAPVRDPELEEGIQLQTVVRDVELKPLDRSYCEARNPDSTEVKSDDAIDANGLRAEHDVKIQESAVGQPDHVQQTSSARDTQLQWDADFVLRFAAWRLGYDFVPHDPCNPPHDLVHACSSGVVLW